MSTSPPPLIDLPPRETGAREIPRPAGLRPDFPRFVSGDAGHRGRGFERDSLTATQRRCATRGPRARLNMASLQGQPNPGCPCSF